MDPKGNYDDYDIKQALDKVHFNWKLLGDKKSKRLDFHVSENGNNFSLGEKQLICFARALIKGNKIIILDEATSSLDIETEKIIQENLEKYLKDVTMIMITHHIHMVKNFKKIIVIEQGRIVESGDYDSLLKNKRSHFYSLYEESRKK